MVGWINICNGRFGLLVTSVPIMMVVMMMVMMMVMAMMVMVVLVTMMMMVIVNMINIITGAFWPDLLFPEALI